MRTMMTAVLILAWGLQAAAQEPWERKVSVPSGVRYQQSDAADLRPTVEKVVKVFSPGYSGEEHLAGSVLICGPFLWRRLGSQAAFGGFAGIPTRFNVPFAKNTVVLEGRTFKDPDHCCALEEAVRAELKEDGQFAVRKLNTQELSLLWAVYPDDLHDPLLLLESAHHKFVLVFLQDRLLHLDDYYHVALKRSDDEGASPGAHAFVQSTAYAFWALPHAHIDPDQLLDYAKKIMAIREHVMSQLTPKTPRDLSLQLELCPGKHFVTVVCDPPLPAIEQKNLMEAMMKVPLPVAEMHSTVALQLFARVWGGTRR